MTFNPKDHMTDLRGRDYLEVKWRLVWFRDDHPKGRIIPTIVNYDPLIVRAEIQDEHGNMLAAGHGSANADGKRVVWTGREIEKAETAAIGRALAHAGYGTQFTGEDEGENIADSPVEKPAPSKNGKPQAEVVNLEQPGGHMTVTHKTPAAWKPDAIKWMVKEGHAKNGPHANEIWKLLELDTCASKAEVVKRVELYRKNKDEANQTTEVAAQHAIAGNDLTA